MISCVVLAGGQSKRMGKDKAFLKIGDKTFLRKILESLSKKCDEIIIVGNKDKELYLKEAQTVNKPVKFTSDIYPYQGPLNGIISALHLINHEKTFISTCDTPLIKPEVVEFLQREIDGFDAVIPVVRNKFQPLNALYRTESLQKAKQLFHKGERSLFSFIKSLNVKFIDQNKIEKVDPQLYSYWSINTPEDYQKLLSIVQ